MISLTPDEERLRDHLIDIVASADRERPESSIRSYGDLAAAIDTDGGVGWRQGHPRYSRVITALYHINKYEAEHGRPMIGALVGHGPKSDKGFADCARECHVARDGASDSEVRRTELHRSVEYWQERATDKAETSLPDAQFNAIMGELATIKKMVRQLLHERRVTQPWPPRMPDGKVDYEAMAEHYMTD
jgi:hypothetical protein